jgi:hypothetical protein
MVNGLLVEGLVEGRLSMGQEVVRDWRSWRNLRDDREMMID